MNSILCDPDSYRDYVSMLLCGKKILVLVIPIVSLITYYINDMEGVINLTSIYVYVQSGGNLLSFLAEKDRLIAVF